MNGANVQKLFPVTLKHSNLIAHPQWDMPKGGKEPGREMLKPAFNNHVVSGTVGTLL